MDDFGNDTSAEWAMFARISTVTDGQLAAFVPREVLDGKTFRTKSSPRVKRERPTRSNADTTCPNCLEKGHVGQACTKTKVEVKDRRSFTCGEPGHSAASCPKGKLKALTRDPPPAEEREGPSRRRLAKYTCCVEADDGLCRRTAWPGRLGLRQP